MILNKRHVLITFITTLIVVFVWIFLYGNPLSKKEKQNTINKKYDIVIYGGGPQAVASALKASSVTNDKKTILMIVPETKLGSIFTAGAQNLFDLRQYTSSKLPEGLPKNYNWAQGGSMYMFYEEPSIVFSPNKMAGTLQNLVKEHSNITVLFEHDIERVNSNSFTKEINSAIVHPIIKDEKNRYVYDQKQAYKISSPIFIDASETGKLTYISGLFNGYVGREDEKNDHKQMVSTLMFKLKGLDMKHVQQHTKEGAPFKFYFTNKGSLGTLGGYEITDNPLFEEYSKNNIHFRLKPYNAGEDGYSGKNQQNNDTEMWMNMLLVYDVDARKMWRDNVIDNGNYPNSGGMDPEIARELAIKEIKSTEFIKLIRTLPGLEQSELVLNEKGEPEVGEIMYLRESIHASNEDGNFALTEKDTIGLSDEKHYKNRIGLGFYNFDSNTYEKEEELSEPRTVKPWYIPYETLISKPKNLLIPGYAANMDSYTWRAMRVYPNLIVLGDAAGVAAGLSSLNLFDIKDPTDEQLGLLQKELVERNAILEK